jgi:anti-sigma regulatory factor (Ser/Thr protein kinase)
MQPLEGTYAGIFPGGPEQIKNARGQAREFLDGYPVTDDVVLILSELATNATVHSLSKGGLYTVRVKRYDTCVYLEVEDAGVRGCPGLQMTADPMGWISSSP